MIKTETTYTFNGKSVEELLAHLALKGTDLGRFVEFLWRDYLRNQDKSSGYKFPSATETQWPTFQYKAPGQLSSDFYANAEGYAGTVVGTPRH